MNSNKKLAFSKLLTLASGDGTVVDTHLIIPSLGGGVVQAPLAPEKQKVLKNILISFVETVI